MIRTCALAWSMGSARGRQAGVPRAASVAAAIWASACGEAGTEPTPADPPHPAMVAVAPKAVTLRTLGDTARVSADVRDQYGSAMAGAHVSWLSRNPTVAEVGPAGLVTAVGNGTTTVVAETRHREVRGGRMMAAGRISDSVAIRVDAPTFTLSGTVTDQRRPSLVLPGVHVRLEGWKRTTTTTDADGRCSLPNVGGTLQVTAHAEFSYVGQTVNVDVDGDLTRDFAMEHNGVAPFRGTSWVTPAILGPDSTVLETLTYAGRGMREVYDRRLRKWIRINAFLSTPTIRQPGPSLARAFSRRCSCTRPPTPCWTMYTHAPMPGVPPRRPTACSFPNTRGTIRSGRMSPRPPSCTSRCDIGRRA